MFVLSFISVLPACKGDTWEFWSYIHVHTYYSTCIKYTHLCCASVCKLRRSVNCCGRRRFWRLMLWEEL